MKQFSVLKIVVPKINYPEKMFCDFMNWNPSGLSEKEYSSVWEKIKIYEK